MVDTNGKLNSAAVPQILAPAGGISQFFAALRSGADAVYLGMKQFNARARADNFSIPDLQALVPLAHRHGMKILVTLNILIKQNELNDLLERLYDLEEIGVDGVIVQDLGLADLVRRYTPGLRLHASTQMAVHNLDGVRQMVRWGFKRVVLARELSAREIKTIVAGAPEIEVESFCHGSLCYSYSGLCFFSGAKDSRSGNRGECAYTCRQPYKVLNEPGQGFLFSMKDLDTSVQLPQLIDAGVHTLKIEGRKKDAQYVAAVVTHYRQLLDQHFGGPTGRVIAEEQKIQLDDDALRYSFQRQTTSFYVAHRYHENVIDLNSPTHAGILCADAIEVLGPQRLRFRSLVDLDVHDGLRLDFGTIYRASPQHGDRDGHFRDLSRVYANDDVQFGVQKMFVRGQQVFTAKAGTIVEIVTSHELNAEKATACFKTRSHRLKEQIEKSTKAQERVRPEMHVELEVRGTIVNVHLYQQKIGACDIGGIESGGVDARFGIAGPDEQDPRYLCVDAWTGDLLTAPDAKAAKQLKKDLRRQILELVRNRRRALSFSEAIPIDETSPVHLSVKIDDLDYLQAINHVDEIVFEFKRNKIPLTQMREAFAKLYAFTEDRQIPLRMALPVVSRAWDEPQLRLTLDLCREFAVNRFEVSNPYGFELLRSSIADPDITTDFTVYQLNSVAQRFLLSQNVRRTTLSIEDDFANIREHLRFADPSSVQAILYKDTPLFIAEACSLTALHGGCPTAKVCGYRTLYIENQKGERFYVAHESCKSIVYAEEAASWSHHQQELVAMGIRHFRVDFLTRPYDLDQVRMILNSVAAQKTIPRTHDVNATGILK